MGRVCGVLLNSCIGQRGGAPGHGRAGTLRFRASRQAAFERCTWHALCSAMQLPYSTVLGAIGTSRALIVLLTGHRASAVADARSLSAPAVVEGSRGRIEAGVVLCRRSAFEGVSPVGRARSTGVERPGEASEAEVSGMAAGGPPLAGRLHRKCPMPPHALCATQRVSGSDLPVGAVLVARCGRSGSVLVDERVGVDVQ